ncbi:MAG: UpxY family transcription antiterminator [Chitinophagaceae bacterium]|nr:UpxY family transcription antiterminator [Chitinophagaceae bacterium]
MTRKSNDEMTEWYALRVPYSRELKLKSFLDDAGVANFLPMKYARKKTGKQTLVPAIHNLLFVNACQQEIDEIKTRLKERIAIYYMMDRALNKPIVVPERQMQHFIAVAGTQDDQILFLDNVPAQIGRGDRVRVIGGIFSGVEGEIMRIRRDRRVVVSVQGLMAVATAFIHPSLLERIIN